MICNHFLQRKNDTFRTKQTHYVRETGKENQNTLP